MRCVQDNGLRYLQFPGLAIAPGLWHGILTRFLSEGDGRRTPLNMGLNCGDSDRRVWANRRGLMTAIGSRRAVFARQIHADQVGVWDHVQDQLLNGEHVDLPGDALVTDVPGTVLIIQTADCQSVLLFDPVKRVIGNVHSGWRGSIRNVVGRTVRTMMERYDCRPQDLICGIGPSLGPCCAEFVHFRREIPEAYWGYRREGDLFDFWQMSVDQLAQAGVARRSISVSGLCTRCNQHLFYSYRGEGKKTGRFVAAIQLKSE
ncbi:MAG: peptidoglycan editing factor PgeF [Desulfobacteraceae bacterium]|nr:MAG: peptidoglycan editing factor PgeF [Desulfobacteraceae bacterium]